MVWFWIDKDNFVFCNMLFTGNDKPNFANGNWCGFWGLHYLSNEPK